jgi:hypothetical protein
MRVKDVCRGAGGRKGVHVSLAQHIYAAEQASTEVASSTKKTVRCCRVEVEDTTRGSVRSAEHGVEGFTVEARIMIKRIREKNNSL